MANQQTKKETDKVECNDPDCKLPSYAHNKVQEKSVVEDWEKTWMKMAFEGATLAEQRDFIKALQKETDDKWKKKIEEACGKINEMKKLEYAMWKDKDTDAFNNGIDQATNIIKKVMGI